MISNEYIICPYCKSKHSKGVAIGQSGVINIFGTEREITCRNCDKSFVCKVDVKIAYKTRKKV